MSLKWSKRFFCLENVQNYLCLQMKESRILPTWKENLTIINIVQLIINSFIRVHLPRNMQKINTIDQGKLEVYFSFSNKS